MEIAPFRAATSFGRMGARPGRLMWPDPAETERILLKVERADPGAAEELWERHRPALRRMVSLRLDQALGRRVDASDVVQDVLLKASQRLDEYLRRPALPFHLWLRQIARDQLIDAHRRHRMAGRRAVDRERSLDAGPVSGNLGGCSSFDLAAQLRDPGPTPGAEAIRRELQRQFRSALERLDDQDREIVLLRHYEQLSNIEAARVLGLSEAAAGMRHLRALRKLRVILGEPSARC